MKKWTFLGFAIVLLVLIAGCRVPEPEEEKPMPEITLSSSEIKEGLKLELSLPRVNYQPGEMLEATLSLINITSEAISFSTRSSQLFDLIRKAPYREREERWSEDKMFLTVITPRHIPAGERLSQVLSWEIKQTRGDFYLTGVTVLFDLNGERLRFKTTPLKIVVLVSDPE